MLRVSCASHVLYGDSSTPRPQASMPDQKEFFDQSSSFQVCLEKAYSSSIVYLSFLSVRILCLYVSQSLQSDKLECLKVERDREAERNRAIKTN